MGSADGGVAARGKDGELQMVTRRLDLEGLLAA